MSVLHERNPVDLDRQRTHGCSSDDRHLRQTVTNPALQLCDLGAVVLLLLFVHVLGGPLQSGLGAAGGRYVDSLAPGILVMTVNAGTLRSPLTSAPP